MLFSLSPVRPQENNSGNVLTKMNARVCASDREREREQVFRFKERERVNGCLTICVERERACVCVCRCARERERNGDEVRLCALTLSFKKREVEFTPPRTHSN